MKRRVIEANFNGGHISSNGGAMLLYEADKQLGLLNASSHCIKDTRDPDAILHLQESQLKQRVFGIALGEENLNDHTELCQDIAVQTAVSCDLPLSSASTLCRFEQRFNRKSAVDIHKVIIEQFIKSYKKPPKQLILDFDATDDQVWKVVSTMGIITTIVFSLFMFSVVRNYLSVIYVKRIKMVRPYLGYSIPAGKAFETSVTRGQYYFSC